MTSTRKPTKRKPRELLSDMPRSWWKALIAEISALPRVRPPKPDAPIERP